MKNYLKITMTLFCISVSNLCSGQIEFESKVLQFLQVIAFNTNYENIEASLMSINMNLLSSEKKDNGTELITFKHPESDVKTWVLYSKDKELIYAKFRGDVVMGANNSIDLTNHGFKVEGQSVGNDYKKEDYPYSFTLQTIDYYISLVYLFNPKFGILDQYADDEY